MIIQEKDLEVIEKMAQSYNMTAVELGKAIVSQTRKRTMDRQFRVSDQEFELISQKARDKGLTVMRYCEYACAAFLKRKEINRDYYGSKGYGEGRKKRITVQFKDIEIEKKLMAFAEENNLELGALMRYCALTI